MPTLHQTEPTEATVFTTRHVPLRPEPTDEISRRIREEIAAEKRAVDFEGANIAVIVDKPAPIPGPATSSDGRPFWPVFVDQTGESVPAWTVAELVTSGQARIGDEDLNASWNIVQDLRRSTHGGFPEASHAHEAIDAEQRRRATEVKARFDAKFPDGPVPPQPQPYFLTKEEVADIFRVSVTTVDRQSGKTLPAPIMVGSQKRWRATAIAAIVGRSVR